MQIFSLISQKGGAGKSTLARQLAVLAGEAGPSVIIDRDPQETSTKWWQRRQALHPPPKRPDLLDLDGSDLTTAMRALRKQHGVVFVDTRPAVADPEAEAARVADLVIVPCTSLTGRSGSRRRDAKNPSSVRKTCGRDRQCGQKRGTGARRARSTVSLSGSGLSNAPRRSGRLSGRGSGGSWYRRDARRRRPRCPRRTRRRLDLDSGDHS